MENPRILQQHKTLPQWGSTCWSLDQESDTYPAAVADLHSKILDARPPGPNSFKFMQCLGKFGKIVCWHPPGELAPPPRGNPGSATGCASLPCGS